MRGHNPVPDNMAEETQYQGIRSGDDWIVKGTVTYREADEMIERRMHGGKGKSLRLFPKGLGILREAFHPFIAQGMIRDHGKQ